MNAIEIKALKDAVDCRNFIAADLGQPISTKGQTWTFSCPFHNERTPGGFHVYRDGYKCFSCGKSGDVLTWLIQFRKMTFQDAVSHIGGDYTDPLVFAQRAQEVAERTARELEQKIAEAQKALADLKRAETWLKWHESMDAQARRLWYERGLDDGWINFWQLGYNPSFSLYEKDGPDWRAWWTSPTLSIPVWGVGWNLQNVKHRLLNEPPRGGKYHPERRLPAAAFVTNPDLRDGKSLLVVEGEIKSMVAFTTMDNPDIQIIGLPGATPDKSIFDGFENYDPVYVILDPDTYESHNGQPPAINRVLDHIGRSRSIVVRLPRKIDDMILAGVLNKDTLYRTMKNGERCK